MKLSILIPTIAGREKHLESLLAKIGTHSDLEVVVEKDNKEMSIGKKRNLLLSKATGDYLVQIDDDDDVPDGYAHKIIQTIERYNGIDCITYNQTIIIDGKYDGLANVSLRNAKWDNATGEFKYLRTPLHVTVTRSEIAKAVQFNDLKFGEDHDWSRRIYDKLQTEIHIPESLYTYLYVSRK